jgi:fatty-acyl-CoA synthase
MVLNLGQWPEKRALLHPQQSCLTFQGEHLNNGDFALLVESGARGLLQAGITKGDRVALLMGNCPAFLQLFFACARIGAVLVPLNHQLTAPELARIIGDSAPKLLVHGQPWAGTVENILSLTPHTFDCLSLGNGDLFASFPPASDSHRTGQQTWSVDENDPLLLIYTSGTSGNLKGALLSHRNLLFGAVHSLLSYHFTPATRSLVVAPLFHIGALAASALPVLYAGGSLVLRSFDNPSEILHLIEKEAITFFFAVPAMFAMLAKAPAWASADFSRVRFFMSGGAPMPVELIRRYQQEKGVVFAQGYGMTETQRITALELADATRKAGSIGKEVFHTSVRLVDDNDVEVEPGAVGEIVVHGPTIFSGYWHNPEANANALRHGWFHTGDLGRRDDEGFLYLVGRKSDLIISSGENVSAAEVEQALEALPEVAEAGVVGLPDTVRGEVVAALVVLRPEVRITAESLLVALKSTLAPYKIPKRVHFTAALPRTGSGKVAKEEIKNIFAGGTYPAEETTSHER